ncbi:MAG: glucokinase [Psychroserpens sp.]|jgi:glucokinase
MSAEVLGVDIGGTNIKAGRVKGSTISQTAIIGVNRNDSKETTLENLFQVIQELMTDTVEAIGIGVPAVVHIDSGIVYDVQNIPAWTKIALKELVQERFYVPVYINNDANCFTLGEKYFGKAKECSNCVALSLGTGLGMGILIDNTLYNGVMCGAGEIGMLPYLDGILEHYTGSFFFDDKYGQSALTLYEKALKSDPIALQAFEEYGLHLSEAIKIILYMYAPELIILGGSIRTSYPFFEKTLKSGIESFAYPIQLENLNIETSDLVDAPILGAAALCL